MMNRSVGRTMMGDMVMMMRRMVHRVMYRMMRRGSVRLSGQRHTCYGEQD
ncbi:MAG TPA: hypothetical protein VNS58_20120 [Puia sp.]|nr:hypothetical protein [Puia sp.]